MKSRPGPWEPRRPTPIDRLNPRSRQRQIPASRNTRVTSNFFSSVRIDFAPSPSEIRGDCRGLPPPGLPRAAKRTEALRASEVLEVKTIEIMPGAQKFVTTDSQVNSGSPFLPLSTPAPPRDRACPQPRRSLHRGAVRLGTFRRSRYEGRRRRLQAARAQLRPSLQ